MAKRRVRGIEYVPYNVEKVFTADAKGMNEYFLENMIKNGTKCVYGCKEIEAGTQFEIELFPEFKKRQEVPGEGLKKDNSLAQKNLNSKNAKKYCIRLINENFFDGDIWATLTYTEENEPNSWEQAVKDVQNYIRRLKYQRNKRLLPAIKYLYIIEYDPDEEIRWHVHIVMDGLLDLDTVESTWKKGERNEVRRLSSDEYGFTGVATYITDKPRHKNQKRWNCSTNLKQFRVRKNHYKYKKKDVEEMAKNQNSIKEIMEKNYPDYIYTDCEVMYNEYNLLFYIYVKMRKKGVNRHAREDNTENHKRIRKGKK